MTSTNWLTFFLFAAVAIYSTNGRNIRRQASWTNTHCPLEVKNNGGYILEVTWNDEYGNERNVEILEGQERIINARRNSRVRFHAVAGDSTSHLMPQNCPAMGGNPVQVVCQGTTWAGFRCEMKNHFSQFNNIREDIFDDGFDSFDDRQDRWGDNYGERRSMGRRWDDNY